MASNVEIKARLAGGGCVEHSLARAMSDVEPTLIVQEDTFFIVPRGRLKLREFGGGVSASTGTAAELIFYERPDTEEPASSTYSLVPVPDPAALKAALTAALGIRGVVKKRRTLYRAGETRIHIDDVEGLGTFLELEVVLSGPGGDEQNEPETAGTERTRTPAEGVARCLELMSALGVEEGDLISRAYIDLLEEAMQ